MKEEILNDPDQNKPGSKWTGWGPGVPTHFWCLKLVKTCWNFQCLLCIALLQGRIRGVKIRLMVSRPESTAVSIVPLPITPDYREQTTPQNSFVNFVEENRQEFSGLSSLTRELRGEEAGRRSSPSFEYLVQEGINITQQSRGTINSKIESQMRRLLTDAVFGSQDSKGDAGKGIIDRLSSAYMRLDPEQKRQLVDWETKTEELGNAYREARRAILSPLREIRGDLFGKFTGYLTGEYPHLFEFAEFLSGPNFRSHRENVRPFLVSLAENDFNARRERQEGILGRARTTWLKRAREDLLEEILPRWIRSVMSSSRGRDPELAQWLRMGVELAKSVNKGSPTEEITEGDIARILKEMGFNRWPVDLRQSYTSFGFNEVSSVITNIQKSLEQFNMRAPQTSSPVVIFEAPRPKKRDQRGKSLIEAGVNESVEKPAEVEKRVYPIGVIKKGVRGRDPFVSLLNEEGLARLIRKKADKIAKGDPGVRDDIEAIIASLREDPYGLGTKKLGARGVTIRQTPLDLRRLDPQERINLPLHHEQSDRLRVLYTLFYTEDEGPPMIVLFEDGIYTHDECDVVLRSSR